MKNIIILVAVLSFFCIPVFCQKNVPDNVKKEFVKKFPVAQSVKWNNEEANEWEAEFKTNGKEMSASFDNNGVWLETETEITAKDLPISVVNTLKDKFPGFKTGEISAIENPQMKGYELALKKEGTSLEVIFDNSGKVIIMNEVRKGKEN